MATLTQLRDGLKTALASITTLRAYAEEPDSITLNASRAVAWPVPLGGEDDTFAGTEKTVFDIVILAASAAPGGGRERGQSALDPYLSRAGAPSIHAALFADRDLGGVAADLEIGPWHSYGIIEVGAVPYWGAKRTVTVWH